MLFIRLTPRNHLSPITQIDKVTSKRDGKSTIDATNIPSADSIQHTSPPDNSPQPPAHTVEAEAQQPSEHTMAEAKQASTTNSTTSHVQFIKNATNRSATIQAWHIKNSAFKFAMKILTPGKEQSPEKVNSNTPKTPEHTATCGNPTDTNKTQAPNANTTTPVGGNMTAAPNPEPMDTNTWNVKTHRKKRPPLTTRAGRPDTQVTHHRICTTHKFKCVNSHAVNMYHEKQDKQQCQVHAINMMKGGEWLDKDAVLNYCMRQAVVNPHWNSYFNCSTGNYTDTVISYIMYHNTNEHYKFKYHGSATDLGTSAQQIKNKSMSCGSAVLLWAECNASEGLPTYNHSMCLKHCPTDGMWYLLDSENLHGPTILDTPEKWEAIRGQLRTLEPAPTNNTHGIHVDLDSPEQANIRHGTGPNSIFTNIIKENAERRETNPPSEDDVIMIDAPKPATPTATRLTHGRGPNTHTRPRPKTNSVKIGRITKTTTVNNRQPLLPTLQKTTMKNICDYYLRKATHTVTAPTHMQVDPPITGPHAQVPITAAPRHADDDMLMMLNNKCDISVPDGVTAKTASQVAPPSKVTNNKAPPLKLRTRKLLRLLNPSQKGRKS